MIFEPGHIMQIISMLPKMSTFMSSENNLYLITWPAQLIFWANGTLNALIWQNILLWSSEPFVEERITRWTECSCCNSTKRSFVCSSILSERPHSPLSLFNIPSLLLTDDMILSMIINTYCQFILGILFNEWCPKDPGTPRQIVWNYYPLNRSLTRVKSRDAITSKKWRGMYIMCIIV